MPVANAFRSFDKGPWRVIPGAVTTSLVASDDFTHDVSLRITGDFLSRTERDAYARALADLLNWVCISRNPTSTWKPPEEPKP